MKKFEFPVNIPSIYIYVGEKEWDSYLLKCTEIGVKFDPEEAELPSSGEGRTNRNVMWLSEVEFTILAHEFQHVKDFAFYVLNIPTELEFRAFVASLYDPAVYQWAIEEMKED